MSIEEPRGADQPVRARAVVGGAFAGLSAALAFYIVVGFLEYAARGDSATTGWVTLGAGVLVALVLGGLLVVRRFRHAAAGLVMGVAIGFIVFSGVCVPWSLTASR